MTSPSHWKHRSVRDLAWVIASPSLVSGYFSDVEWWGSAHLNAEYLACVPSLELLDKNPAPLEQHLKSLKSKALGHRFEALVGFWLEISPSYELIDRNIQIQGEDRTLGELDFIIRDHYTGALIHLEVSVKFYMGLRDLKNPLNWYGSNLKDSFGKKTDHLKQHQTQLSQLYPEKMKYSIDQRCCCMKGRLFYPEALSESAIDTEQHPEETSVEHLQGVWGESVDLFASQQSDITYFPIQKSEWLTEFVSRDIPLFMQRDNGAELRRITVDKWQAGEESSQRPQCYVLTRQGEEVIRYFEFPEGYFDSVYPIS